MKVEFDVDAVRKALKGFIRSHDTQFQTLAQSESALLEVGALAVATQHYARRQYAVQPMNLIAGDFRVKTSAKGRPLNFSWFEVSRDHTRFEVHANLGVRSAYGLDDGIYVVDVGVVRKGCIPNPTPKEWPAVDNKALITFIEAKKLVIYPMLLAQFVGIVHEVKPQFINGRRPWGFLTQGHFDPALVSIGYLHGISSGIEGAFLLRGIKVKVVPSFDIEIARMRGDPQRESALA